MEKEKTFRTYAEGTPVIVTTNNRGVFFGYYVERFRPSTVVLKDARNIVYWPQETKGFLSLASVGPNPGCRITPSPAPFIEALDVTSIIECTAEAAKQWEKAYWGK